MLSARCMERNDESRRVSACRFYKSLVFYCFFLSLLLFSIFNLVPIHDQFEHNAAFRDLFFRTEFSNLILRKTFDDVMVPEEMWQWVEGPFADGLLSGYLDENRLVGAVQVRQVRVAPSTVDCGKARELFDGVSNVHVECYPEWSTSHNDESPFSSEVHTTVLCWGDGCDGHCVPGS